MRNNKHTFFTLRRFIAICMAMLVMLGANATALTAESGQDITTGDEPVTETAVSSTPETTEDTDEKEITSEDSEEEIEETDIPASDPETEIISEGEPETEPNAEDNPEPEGELKTEGEPEEIINTDADQQDSETEIEKPAAEDVESAEVITELPQTSEEVISETENKITEDSTEEVTETEPAVQSLKKMETEAPDVKLLAAPVLAAANEASTKLTVHVTNILYINQFHPESSIDGHAVAWEETATIDNNASQGKKKYINLIGGTGRTAGGIGYTYKSLDGFVITEQGAGPVYSDTLDGLKTIERIRYQSGNATVEFTDGSTQVFENTDNIYISPVYKATENWYLEYNYIDNISTGSGSWSNKDAVVEYQHTFTDPSEKSPSVKENYQFVEWRNDETGVVYKAGDTFIYSGTYQKPGTKKIINIHAYWQPAITVNYHVMGSVAKSEKNFSEVKVYDYTPEDKGNIHFEGWYSDPELTQRIDESAVETAHAITKDKDTAKVVDVYARFVTAKTVSKVWDDTDDKDGIRPASVQVQLNKAGEAFGEPVTLSADNKWTYTFEDLTAYDKDGSEIEYTIDEVEVPRGYTKTVVSEENTVTITNAHTLNPTPTPTSTPTPTTPPTPTKTPTPTSTPTPESKSDKTPAPTMTPDYVVTCQMAGYPENYAWNEAAKACQPGYIDDFGVFHSTAARRVIPNTYDKGLMGNLITFMISDLLGIAIVLILKKY